MSVVVGERKPGGVTWVAIRARGAEWSWLTPKEAAEIGQQWIKQYGAPTPVNSAPTPVAEDAKRPVTHVGATGKMEPGVAA
jgi:hypothetical protein